MLEVKGGQVPKERKGPLEESNLNPDLREMVGHGAVRHFEVAFIGKGGSVLHTGLFSLDCRRAEPVFDHLPYCFEKGVLNIGLTSRAPAGLRFRSRVLMEESESGFYGLLDCAPKEPQHLISPVVRGGLYFPSAGGSIEAGYSTIIEDKRRQLNAEYIPAQQVVDAYLRGEFYDLRALLAIFRLSDELGYKIKVSRTLERPFRTISDSLIPTRELNELAPSNANSSLVASVRCREAGPPRTPFLSSYKYGDFISVGAGDPEREKEIVVRRGIDSVDVAAYAVTDSGPCLVIKKGIRPAMPVRNILSGEEASCFNAFEYEGVAESLEGENTLDQVAWRAAQGIREEAGLEPMAEAVILGFGHPAPDTSPEKVYNFLIPVNLRKASSEKCTIDERLDVCLAHVNDIIEAGNRGWIKDPRLLINAYLLRSI